MKLTNFKQKFQYSVKNDWKLSNNCGFVITWYGLRRYKYKIFRIFADLRLFPFYWNLTAFVPFIFLWDNGCQVSIKWKQARVSKYAEYLIYLYLLRPYQVMAKPKLFDGFQSFFTEYWNFCLNFFSFVIFLFLYIFYL